ncbi:MAG: O-antigen ligase family protein [Chloroflexi bacterium]|nr:O-antigen ligase family protein [Chloroflexota bacterium]
MIQTFVLDYDAISVAAQARKARWAWRLWFLGLLGLSAVVALFMFRSGANPSSIGWLIYLIGIAVILYRPRYGIYLTLFFALAGDSVMTYWYPFVKNLSSMESLLFVHSALILSPAEIYIGVTLLSWLGRSAMQRKLDFYASPLLWPALLFIGFIIFGLGYGISRGGAINIALWESRPIFYLLLLLLLTSNLITTRRHVENLMWAIMLAIFIEGLNGVYMYLVVFNGDLGYVESLTEHSSAIHMNTFFLFLIALWVYKGSSLSRRLWLLVMVPPVLLTYLAAQRRAAFVALIIALILVAVILFRERRTTFWFIVPLATLVGILYVAAFWNNTSALGMGAQAVKSVIAEDQASAQDQRSNLYRDIENVNSAFTIRQKTLTGVGFGKKFFILVPLPDISFFIWWEYITHNSVIWIWMKTGVGGFASMIFLIGLSIMVGMRALWRMPGGDLSAVALTAVLYIIMHFVYAYVDMSWDNQSMIYVGTMMGLLGSLERIVGQPVPVLPRRWPWQPMPKPAPGLLDLPGMR